MDEAANIVSIIGEEIPLACIILMQSFSCPSAELRIEIAFLNPETRSQAHQCRAEQAADKRRDDDDQQMPPNYAHRSHEGEVPCGYLNPQYDSPIRDRPVFMGMGNIASTVRNQAFCREYDLSLRLRVRREMPSTRAAFC